MTDSGLEIKDSYQLEDLALDKLDQAGHYPFTRGIHSSMYRGQFWTMRQYAGFGNAEQTNQRYKYLLEKGVTGLSVAFDLPTQMGRDSDDQLARGEVGRVGVAISCLENMHSLLADLPLEKVSISMTINSTAAILLGFLLVVAEERGVPWSTLRGTIQNDVLKEYIARGTYIYPPRAALRIITDIFEFCSKEVPNWNTISISGYHIREAGSTAVQELAFTFADAIAYVDAAVSRGLKLDDFAPRLAFFFNCHNNFLEEIAKFRAARRIWAKIIRERYKCKDDRSAQLRFHTQTAGSSLTAQQPHNNIVRTSLQALAAVMGGTQSLHTNGFDEALALPTEESAALALRTQQIIAHESGVADVVDPFGGSYYVESLTDRMEQEVFKELERIDQMGGMLLAIENAYPQSEIERSSYDWQKQVENLERVIVGVNEFKEADEVELTSLHRLDQSVEIEQVKKLQAFKSQRKMESVTPALEALRTAANGSANLMPLIIQAIKAGATLGEIAQSMASVFGEYR